ncbi:hypothetical protein MesoLjLc_51790 [Mesorhizobium sp. L-8-10]|uniref:exonuclease domain-containing protein n=1 Tax=Mesorhizobium sp. L-8-10 TaxID=2744523 RepID=UPI001926DDF1|nr:exonuclease domain-containing protein [Mesorhizobium sp. L-8-10]BCH33249.1 hypothetical protein MesoLjLc_51790 [Mesorhizobium sp. L-8-10]
MLRVRVIDLESSGDAPPEHGLVEIGYCDLVANSADLLGEPCDWEVFGGFSELVNPGCPIPPETSAVHHIIDEDVAGGRPWREALPAFLDGDGVIAFAAHGADFEAKWLSDELRGGKPLICTYKAAIRKFPAAPSHSNMGLRYWRNPDGLERERALPAHRAFPDAYATAFLLRDVLNDGHTIAELAKWTGEPALLPRCKIGDYRNDGKGTPYSEVDSGMLRWIIRIMADDPRRENDVHTARYHLEQREIDQRLEYERMDLERQLHANGLDDNNHLPATELPL